MVATLSRTNEPSGSVPTPADQVHGQSSLAERNRYIPRDPTGANYDLPGIGAAWDGGRRETGQTIDICRPNHGKAIGDPRPRHRIQ